VAAPNEYVTTLPDQSSPILSHAASIEIALRSALGRRHRVRRPRAYTRHQANPERPMHIKMPENPTPTAITVEQLAVGNSIPQVERGRAGHPGRNRIREVHNFEVAVA